MSKGKRVRDEVPEKILKRHNEIRRRYEEMLARERAENPERLKYLSKTYFVDMISKDPVIGLSPNYGPAYHQRAHLMSGQYWLRMKFG